MVDERLIAFIKKEAEKKTSELAIKKKLKDAGWHEKDITEALQKINSSKAVHEPKKIETPVITKIEDIPNRKGNKSNGFFTKIWQILAHPKNFFSDVATESIKSSIILFSILIGLLTLITLIVTIISTDYTLFASVEFLSTIGYMLLFLLMIYVFFAIYILMTFGLVKLFKGVNSISETTKAMLYGTVPSIVFAWIATIIPTDSGWIILSYIILYGVWLWTLSLQGYGLAKLHSLSWWKILIIIIVPLIIFIIMFYLISYYYMPVY